MKKTCKKTQSYYECDRCKIDSLTKNRMCPCPRGSCEAVKKGEIVTTTELIINKPVTTTNEQPILTDLELNWLKYELEARNQEYGYDPNDLKIKNSIIKKLG